MRQRVQSECRVFLSRETRAPEWGVQRSPTWPHVTHVLCFSRCVRCGQAGHPRLLPSLPVPLLLFLSPGAHHTPEDQEPLRVPVAAVTKDHKRRGLNWQKCVLLQLWRSGSKLGLARLESRAAPFWGPQGRLCRFAGMAGVFASPSDSYVEILSPDVTALGGGDNGR